MKKKIFIASLFLIAIISQEIKAQNADLPPVIGPSPEVALLQKYIQHSVDHSTGAMSLSIPIHEISKGAISIPLTIGYYTTGRRLADETGALGLGWSLNAGGCSLTRTVNGLADDKSTKPYNYYYADQLKELYKNEKGVLYLNKQKYYEAVNKMYTNIQTGYIPGIINNIDTEYDILNYTIPGYSGYFIMNNNNPVKLNNQPIKIIVDFNHLSGYNSFTITDDKGITYKFTSGDISDQTITSWVIKEISTADGQKVTFNYMYGSKKVHQSYQKKEIIDNHMNNSNSFGNTNPNGLHNSTNYSQFGRLKSIDYGHGKVEITTEAYYDMNNNKQKEGGKISNIIIKNSLGTVVKKINCSYSSLDQRVDKLDALIWKDKTDKDIEKYTFNYYPSSNSGHLQKDFWGYKNSNPSNDNLLPAFSIYQYSVKVSLICFIISQITSCIVWLSHWKPVFLSLSALIENVPNDRTNLLPPVNRAMFENSFSQ